MYNEKQEAQEFIDRVLKMQIGSDPCIGVGNSEVYYVSPDGQVSHYKEPYSQELIEKMQEAMKPYYKGRIFDEGLLQELKDYNPYKKSDMNSENKARAEIGINQPPVLREFQDELRVQTDRMEKLIDVLQSKLRTILIVPSFKENDLKRELGQSECYVHDLRNIMDRINANNSKLENCLEHLDQII